MSTLSHWLELLTEWLGRMPVFEVKRRWARLVLGWVTVYTPASSTPDESIIIIIQCARARYTWWQWWDNENILRIRPRRVKAKIICD